MSKYDVIVLGLGGMGSSTVYHLAQSGVKVLGLEQFTEAHALGSSHGKTRLIRKAYFEHPDYVPLLHQSYDLWHQLENLSQEKLLHLSGLTLFGSSASAILKGVRKSKDQFDLKVREVSEVEAQHWNPVFHVPKGFVGVEEPGAGFLEVEKCIKAYLKVARSLGAEIRFEQPCLSWGANSKEVWVETGHEKIYADKLVITAGPWTSQILQDLNLKLQVHRVPQFWFQGKNISVLNQIKSCFAFDMSYGFIYGFPVFSHSKFLKVAIHKPGEKVNHPSEVRRNWNEQDHVEVSQFLKQVLPEIDPKPMEGSICLYTMSPDEHFVIDQHPSWDRISFAAGFSGHGFKFASAVGKILSDGACLSKYPKTIDFLRLRPIVLNGILTKS
ncbi:MAG: N-methyl-L-tryptophan oxidase [Deltaproteobacteria bacterium]